MQNDLSKPIEERAPVAFLWLVAPRVAIAEANDVRWTLEGEFHGIHRGRNLTSLGINRANCDRHGILAITGDRPPVGHKLERHGITRRFNAFAGNFAAVLFSDGEQLAGRVDHIPMSHLKGIDRFFAERFSI